MREYGAQVNLLAVKVRIPSSIHRVCQNQFIIDNHNIQYVMIP